MHVRNFQILKWAAYIQPKTTLPFSYHYLISWLRYLVIILYYYMAAQRLIINVREHLNSELGRAYLAWKYMAIFVLLSYQLIEILNDLYTVYSVYSYIAVQRLMIHVQNIQLLNWWYTCSIATHIPMHTNSADQWQTNEWNHRPAIVIGERCQRPRVSGRTPKYQPRSRGPLRPAASVKKCK